MNINSPMGSAPVTGTARYADDKSTRVRIPVPVMAAFTVVPRSTVIPREKQVCIAILN